MISIATMSFQIVRPDHAAKESTGMQANNSHTLIATGTPESSSASASASKPSIGTHTSIPTPTHTHTPTPTGTTTAQLQAKSRSVEGTTIGNAMFLATNADTCTPKEILSSFPKPKKSKNKNNKTKNKTKKRDRDRDRGQEQEQERQQEQEREWDRNHNHNLNLNRNRSINRNRTSRNKCPSKQSQTTTMSAMEKYLSFLKAQAKFGDAITVRDDEGRAVDIASASVSASAPPPPPVPASGAEPSSLHSSSSSSQYPEIPSFSNMSLSIRRQHWTQFEGGKPFSGNPKLAEPEVTVVGTSKGRILADILELLHHFGKDSDSDLLEVERTMVHAGKLVHVDVALSAFHFISKFFTVNRADAQSVPVTQTVPSHAHTDIATSSGESAETAMYQTSFTSKVTCTGAGTGIGTGCDVQYGRKNTGKHHQNKRNIKWCLSESEPLSKSVEQWSRVVLQNRKTKTKTQDDGNKSGKKQKLCDGDVSAGPSASVTGVSVVTRELVQANSAPMV